MAISLCLHYLRSGHVSGEPILARSSNSRGWSIFSQPQCIIYPYLKRCDKWREVGQIIDQPCHRPLAIAKMKVVGLFSANHNARSNRGSPIRNLKEARRDPTNDSVQTLAIKPSSILRKSGGLVIWQPMITLTLITSYQMHKMARSVIFEPTTVRRISDHPHCIK
jgi:hypothetical protein